LMEPPDVESLERECAKLRDRSLLLDGLPSSLRLAIGDREGLKSRLPEMVSLASDLVESLINDYAAEVELPRNVDPAREFSMTAWPDEINQRLVGLAIYAWFPFSIYRSDAKAEYEPIEFVFLRDEDRYRLLYAYARVHYDLCEYALFGLRKVRLRFMYHGHTPYVDGVGYVRVRCPKVKSSLKHTGRRYWNRIWLGAALTFERIVKGATVPLSLLLKHGVLSLMQCPNDSVTNPFKSPIRV